MPSMRSFEESASGRTQTAGCHHRPHSPLLRYRARQLSGVTMQYTALVAGLLFLGGAAALTDQCTLNCGTADGTQPLICPNSCTQWSP